MEEAPHVEKEMLGRLARRELAPSEIAAVLRHAGTCPECARLASRDLEAEADLLQAMLAGDAEASAHPDHEELVAYIDGTLGAAEREIVESHLDDCPRCSTDVGDLLALRPTKPRMTRLRTAVIAAVAATIAAVMILLRSDDAVVPAPAQKTPDPPRPVVTETTTATATPPPVVEKPRYAKGEWERLVNAAIATGVLTFPKDFAPKSDALRGADDVEKDTLHPSGIYVDETRPRLTWPARDGATYVVSIFSGDEEIAQSGPLTSTSWTPPKSLARGRTYIWQVEATRGDEREILPAPPAPPAMFRVVSARDHDELALARREHPDDHALHAVLAARAGLREDALAAWARAKK